MGKRERWVRKPTEVKRSFKREKVKRSRGRDRERESVGEREGE